MARQRNAKMASALAARGITGTELARRTGLSRGTITAVLNKRVVPTVVTRDMIADALGVTVKYLWPGMET